jgi:hypothetical protein
MRTIKKEIQMKSQLIVAFVVAARLETTIPAHAQNIEWENLNDEVIALYKKGDYST